MKKLLYDLVSSVMYSAEKLIAAVKSHKVLYAYNHQVNERESINLWNLVAKECNAKNGKEAQIRWNNLVLEYFNYLTKGEDFPLAANMYFTQTYLFGAIDDPAVEDEYELERNLNSNDVKNKSLIVGDIDERITGEYTEKTTDEGIINTFNNLTHLELIFLGYARQLQRMPQTTQMQIKRKIADIIDEGEICLLNAA
uniref:MADF domain-containing protein n=1 Tax=Glossina brevipalpis TaxID=37001 RepID=A0A1A9WPV5_9MUSC